jgi:hypothetical protein
VFETLGQLLESANRDQSRAHTFNK